MRDIVAVYEWYCEGSPPGDHKLTEGRWEHGEGSLKPPVVRSFGEDVDEYSGVRVLFNGQSPLCGTCDRPLRRRQLDRTFRIPV